MKTRIEHDLLGDMEIPDSAWYGIQTQRAIDNFSITGVPICHFPQLINALAMVKQAAAHANEQTGELDSEKAAAIKAACDDIIEGRLHDQFQVDLIQGGAGTSTNMNVNEVIANLALNKLGYSKGCYQKLHPNNDVNKSQSTNDAMKMRGSACEMFEKRCIKNITINREQCKAHVENSIGIVTAFWRYNFCL